jgi:hypothetical protein
MGDDDGRSEASGWWRGLPGVGDGGEAVVLAVLRRCPVFGSEMRNIQAGGRSREGEKGVRRVVGRGAVKGRKESRGQRLSRRRRVFFLQGVALCGSLGEWGERVKFLGFFVVSPFLQNCPFHLCVC